MAGLALRRSGAGRLVGAGVVCAAEDFHGQAVEQGGHGAAPAALGQVHHLFQQGDEPGHKPGTRIGGWRVGGLRVGGWRIGARGRFAGLAAGGRLRLQGQEQLHAFDPREGRQQQAEAALLGRHEHYECWRKQELPARWHYGTHPRIPAIVCQMDKGWDALSRKSLANRAAGTRGSHGYDPAEPAMHAIFIARGPSFREGAVIPAFDNVDVYPLLARLLGIPAAPNDGNPRTLLPVLRETPAPGH